MVIKFPKFRTVDHVRISPIGSDLQGYKLFRYHEAGISFLKLLAETAERMPKEDPFIEWSKTDWGYLKGGQSMLLQEFACLKYLRLISLVRNKKAGKMGYTLDEAMSGLKTVVVQFDSSGTFAGKRPAQEDAADLGKASGSAITLDEVWTAYAELQRFACMDVIELRTNLKKGHSLSTTITQDIKTIAEASFSQTSFDSIAVVNAFKLFTALYFSAFISSDWCGGVVKETDELEKNFTSGQWYKSFEQYLMSLNVQRVLNLITATVTRDPSSEVSLSEKGMPCLDSKIFSAIIDPAIQILSSSCVALLDWRRYGNLFKYELPRYKSYYEVWKVANPGLNIQFKTPCLFWDRTVEASVKWVDHEIVDYVNNFNLKYANIIDALDEFFKLYFTEASSEWQPSVCSYYYMKNSRLSFYRIHFSSSRVENTVLMKEESLWQFNPANEDSGEEPKSQKYYNFVDSLSKGLRIASKPSTGRPCYSLYSADGVIITDELTASERKAYEMTFDTIRVNHADDTLSYDSSARQYSLEIVKRAYAIVPSYSFATNVNLESIGVSVGADKAYGEQFDIGDLTGDNLLKAFLAVNAREVNDDLEAALTRKLTALIRASRVDLTYEKFIPKVTTVESVKYNSLFYFSMLGDATASLYQKRAQIGFVDKGTRVKSLLVKMAKVQEFELPVKTRNIRKNLLPPTWDQSKKEYQSISQDNSVYLKPVAFSKAEPDTWCLKIKCDLEQTLYKDDSYVRFEDDSAYIRFFVDNVKIDNDSYEGSSLFYMYPGTGSLEDYISAAPAVDDVVQLVGLYIVNIYMASKYKLVSRDTTSAERIMEALKEVITFTSRFSKEAQASESIPLRTTFTWGQLRDSIPDARFAKARTADAKFDVITSWFEERFRVERDNGFDVSSFFPILPGVEKQLSDCFRGIIRPLRLRDKVSIQNLFFDKKCFFDHQMVEMAVKVLLKSRIVSFGANIWYS